MTEITRVPLPPIASGSVSKLMLGVFVAALGGMGIAACGKPPMVDVQTVRAGKGPMPTADDYVLIDYTGRLPNGTVFDSQQHAVMPLAQVVPGFAKAVEQMQAGGRYNVVIPASLGYGDHAVGPIPANTDLHFTIDLLEFRTKAQIQQAQQMMEQIRALRGAQGSAGQGSAGGPAGAGAGGSGVPDGASPGVSGAAPLPISGQ